MATPGLCPSPHQGDSSPPEPRRARMDTSALVPAFTSLQSFFTFPLDAIHTWHFDFRGPGLWAVTPCDSRKSQGATQPYRTLRLPNVAPCNSKKPLGFQNHTFLRIIDPHHSHPSRGNSKKACRCHSHHIYVGETGYNRGNNEVHFGVFSPRIALVSPSLSYSISA